MRELIIDKLVILYEQRQFGLKQLHVRQTEATLHVWIGHARLPSKTWQMGGALKRGARV